MSVLNVLSKRASVIASDSLLPKKGLCIVTGLFVCSVLVAMVTSIQAIVT